MSRRRSELRDKAFLMWEKSGRKMKLVDIAKRLGLSASQVRKWKYQDAWEARPRRKRGGQPGNQNAAGNKGGGAPLGNKNNWRHGGYESMWMSQLTTEHKLRLMKEETEPRKILLNEIRLYEFREFLLMKNIKDIEEGRDKLSIERRYEFYDEEDGEAAGAQEMKMINGVPNFKPVIAQRRRIAEEKTKQPHNTERLLQIHNALTAVQSRKVKCISLLDQLDHNELTEEEIKVRIERMQLEVNKLKQEAW